MRNFYIFACGVALILSLSYVGIHYGLASSDGDPDPTLDPYLEEQPKQELPKADGWVYGFIEHEHDLDKANLFYMKLQASPESKVPGVDGNYSTTDVNVFVKLRGVDVGKSMHHARHRKRPHVYQREERKRWAETLHYLWNLVDLTHTFRVHNMVYIGTELDGDLYEDGIIEADLELLLGGNWHNLAIIMMQDEHARPIQEGTIWDAGSKAYSLLNPNIPK